MMLVTSMNASVLKLCFQINISLYRSSSQSSDEFENFVYNLDLMLEAEKKTGKSLSNCHHWGL